MENFTKKPWMITQIDLRPTPEEKKDHIIQISEATDREGGVTVKCLHDPGHTYQPGIYQAGPPERIIAKDFYTITLIPGEPHNHIIFQNLTNANAGSWTADDSSSPAGGE